MKSTDFAFRKYAYDADDLIEIMEEDGYVNEKKLRIVVAESYMEDIVPISKEDFIKFAMDRILRNPKYKEFLKGEIKMCSKCEKIKPLSSFRYNPHAGYIDNRLGICCKCEKEYYSDKWENDPEYREKKIAYNKAYAQNNIEKVRETKLRYYRENANKINRQKKEHYVKKSLMEAGFKGIDKENVKDILSIQEHFKRKGINRTRCDIALEYAQQLNLDITEVNIKKVERGKKRGKVASLDHEVILTEIKKGRMYKDIAKEHGCTVSAVSRIASDNGIVRGSGKVKSKVKMVEIADLLKQGKKYREIAQILGCSASLISKIINNNGGKAALLAD